MDAFEELVRVIQERNDNTKATYSVPFEYIEGRIDAYEWVLMKAAAIRATAKK